MKGYSIGSCCANSAATADTRDGAEEVAERARYNASPDEGIASNRSKHKMRSKDESSSARSGDLPIGTGLSLRMPMAGRGENDQFPYSTDAYGKPWS